MHYSDEELLTDIQAVADRVDRSPTLGEYREYGNHSTSTVAGRFGSWNAAVSAAGFEPRTETTRIPTDELLAELTRVADVIDTPPPTKADMDTHGQYASSTYQNRFDSWLAALRAAGFESIPPGQDSGIEISSAELLAEIQRLSDGESPPKLTDMEANGRYSSSTYKKRFDSWNHAVALAGFEPRTGTISTDQLLADLHRLESELGHRPSSRDVATHGDHSVETYQRRFGSWNAALEAAFADE